jgi:ribosome-binding factor A
MRKVDELIREVLADEVAQLKDPRIGFVTVTGVETAPDLRRATVFYSVLGTEDERKATATALVHAAPHLQARLGRQVRIKYTPVLDFRIDPSIEQGVRISKLLHDLEEEDRPGGTTGEEE